MTSQLATTSKLQVERDPELAILLAAAGRVVNDQDDVQAALSQALYTRFRAGLHAHTDSINDIALAPDGSFLVTAGTINNPLFGEQMKRRAFLCHMRPAHLT